MAPFLNGAHPDGAPDGPPTAATRDGIPEHLTWMDPQNRKIRVLTIGAGISGILMAYRIQKDCANVEHVIYERNHDVGGRSRLTGRSSTLRPMLIRSRHMVDPALSPSWV